MAVRFSRRLSAVLLTLALAATQVGVCAGWMPTPEARMACCSEDGSCPMHQPDSQDDGSRRIVSQADADRCCAASEDEESIPSPSSAAFSVTFAVLLSPFAALLPEPESGPDFCASVPVPTRHVPKHVLLSVFLV
jgi:hypothetical protein